MVYTVSCSVDSIIVTSACMTCVYRSRLVWPAWTANNRATTPGGSPCIHRMNRVNSCNAYKYDDSTIKMVLILLLFSPLGVKTLWLKQSLLLLLLNPLSSDNGAIFVVSYS